MKKLAGLLTLVAILVTTTFLLILRTSPRGARAELPTVLPVALDDPSAPPVAGELHELPAIGPAIGIVPERTNENPTHEPGQPAREQLAPSPPAGILRCAGAALAGATLTWTTLLPELDGIEFLNDVDFERVRASTITCASDAAGRFAFTAVPEGAARDGSVLWITAPGREASSALLAASESGWSVPSEISAPERAPIHVLVQRAGMPVAGAHVRQVLSFWYAEQPAPEKRLRRVFLREGETGDDGALLFAPGAGENAFLATQGDESSLLWVGEPGKAASDGGYSGEKKGGEIVLELLPSIEVAGRVVLDTPAELASLLTKARCNVGYFDAADKSDLVYARGSRRVRPDGTFGPDRWPWLARKRLLVHVGNGELVPVQDELVNPGAGASVVVELHTSVGVELALSVASKDGHPLGGASARVFHETHGDWSEVGQMSTGEDGHVRLRGLPPGHAFLSVTKPGFTAVEIDDERTLLPCNDARPIEAILAPAGVVNGFVVQADEPVKDFELFAWSADRSYRLERHVHDEEGAFRIEDAPRGEPLSLVAYTDALPESEIASIVPGAAPEAANAELVLELPVAHKARGRVLDTLTHLPVTTAVVQHLTSGPDGFGSYRGARMPVQADGSFELDGFFPGRGGFALVAAGYESLFYKTREDDTEVIDVGLLALNPLSVLDVVAREPNIADYSAYRAWNRMNDGWVPLALGRDGRLALPSRTGAYEVHLLDPEGGARVARGIVSAGERKTVAFESADGVVLTVTVADPPPTLAGWKLAAFTRAGEFDRCAEARWSPELGAFRLHGLAPGDALLELRAGDGSLAVQRALHLGAEAFQSATLELTSRRRRVRLLDARGAPWKSITVYACLDDHSGWAELLETDVHGELLVGPLNETRVMLSAKLANESIAYGVPVELEPDPARTTTVTLEPGPRVLLHLVEEGAPCTGVHIAFRHEHAPRTLEFGYISDESGLIRGPFCARGIYSARVNHARYWPALYPIPTNGLPDPLVLELYSRATLTFTVTTLANAPLSLAPIRGAQLELVHEELGEKPSTWIAAGRLPPDTTLTTDSTGTITLTGIPRGTYTWTCTAPSGERTTGKTKLAPAAQTTVPIRIDIR